MQDALKHLIARFPERADAIRGLFDSNTRFRDLIGDHHDVSSELSRMEAGDRESDAGRFQALERRRADLEEELILLMENHQRT